MTPTIQLNGVSKFFGNIIALKDISFEAHKGEVTALLGDNGAGKSTLIKCLSGVHAPDEGEIIIEGKPVKFSSPRQAAAAGIGTCLLYTSPSPRDRQKSRMPSSA